MKTENKYLSCKHCVIRYFNLAKSKEFFRNKHPQEGYSQSPSKFHMHVSREYNDNRYRRKIKNKLILLDYLINYSSEKNIFRLIDQLVIKIKSFLIARITRNLRERYSIASLISNQSIHFLLLD